VAGQFLAEAGIQRGIMEIFYKKNNNLKTEENELWRTDGTRYEVQTDKGNCIVSITDESGKVDINRAPEVILRNLFGNLGLEEEDADIVVDSILDWKDPDDLHRLQGAETDYYRSLPNPYEAKNADFNTLEELIMVKGMTPDILYGDGIKKGAVQILTVNSPTGKININIAPREVLMAIPGITSDIADAIISNRNNQGIINMQEILGQSFSSAAPYLSLSDAGVFTIDAIGYNSSEKAGYGIRATVRIIGNNGYRYLYYKSPASVMPAYSQNPEDF